MQASENVNRDDDVLGKTFLKGLRSSLFILPRLKYYIVANDLANFIDG